jgi:D-alanyl-D-alanine carboxypeptidase
MDPAVGDWSTVAALHTSAFAVAARAVTACGLAALLIVLVVAPAWARYSDIVIDARTGAVLHEDHADLQNYPASLTKLMTLYLAFEALERGQITLDQTTVASAHAAAQAPTKLGLTKGARISIRDLVLGLITQSANDAAVVMGETLGGTEAHFAELMTAKARMLGMSSTTFKNASGLPNRAQKTTARDMAKLALAIQRDFPHYYSYFSTPEFTYKGTTFHNHNHLLGKNGVDGMKTGFIQASGFNLVASAEQDGRRYIAVVLGGETPKSRDKEVAMLLGRAFAGDLTAGTTRVAALPARPTAFQTAAAAPAKATSSKAKAAHPATKKMVASAASTIPASAAGGIGETFTNWAIQVGAYSRQASARDAATKALSQLAQIVEDAEVAVIGGGKALYRARIVGLTEATAQESCRLLKQRGTDCMAIGPSASSHSVAAVPN